MPNTVIYHRADFDGLFSAAVCRQFMEPETEFIGWDYNDPLISLDKLKPGPIYVVDLNPSCIEGFNPEDIPMRERIVWIDHHKSAIEKFKDHDIPGYRVDGVAACRLCWQWFASLDPAICFASPGDLPKKSHFVDRDVNEPLALTLAGEYDVWDLRDECTLPFQFGLTAAKYTFDDGLNSMLDEQTTLKADKRIFLGDLDTYAIMLRGKDALNWQRAFAESTFLEKVYLREIEGLTFACLASVHARGSMWFPDDLIPEEVDALLSWRYDGKSVAFSLYHAPGREHHDLSLIATKFGGGGHRGACGFHLELDQALELIR